MTTGDAQPSPEARWARATEWPLTVLAVAFLGAYAWPILDPDLGATWAMRCTWVSWAAWAGFATDYVVRLALSTDRGAFVRSNVLDLLAVALPLLRPLRLLRLVALLSVLNRRAGGSLRGRVATYVAGATTLVIFVSSLAVLDAERRGSEPNITTFSDAVWWSVTTVTTVGYGDRYPTTGTGRFIAAGLMLAGIALLGVVTASLASWLIDRVRDIEEASQQVTREDVASLARQVAELRAELAGVGKYEEADQPPGHARRRT